MAPGSCRAGGRTGRRRGEVPGGRRRGPPAATPAEAPLRVRRDDEGIVLVTAVYVAAVLPDAGQLAEEHPHMNTAAVLRVLARCLTEVASMAEDLPPSILTEEDAL